MTLNTLKLSTISTFCGLCYKCFKTVICAYKGTLQFATYLSITITLLGKAKKLATIIVLAYRPLFLRL